MICWRTWLQGGVWPIAVALVGACSLVGDSSPEQCVDEAECIARLGEPPPGVEWRCIESVCEPAERDAPECVTTSDCEGAFSDAPAQFRGPAYCGADGTCQPVVDTSNRNCRPINYLEEDDQIVIGVLAPTLIAPSSGFGAEPAVERALELVNNVGVGPIGDQRQNVAAVVCTSDPDSVGDNVRWLGEELGVAAILTEQTTTELAVTFAEVDPEGPVIVATANHDDRLSETIADPLYFAGVAPFQSLLPAFAAAVSLASAQAVELGSVLDQDEVKHLAVTTTAELPLGRTEDLQFQIGRLNLEVTLEEEVMNLDAGVSAVLETLLPGLDEPDVIYVLTEDTRFVDEVIGAIEGELIDRGSSKKPVYVLGTAFRANDALVALLIPNLDQRVIGIEQFTNANAFETFASDVYGSDEPHLGYHVLFDAIIAVSLAAHRTVFEGGDPQVGAELAARLSAFGSGEPSNVLVNQDAITGAFSQASEIMVPSVHPRGISGDWVFDSETRARSMEISGYCLVPASSDPPTWDFSLGQLTFSEADGFSGLCWPDPAAN